MKASEAIARQVIEYVFENDVLTQHGMKHLKEKIVEAMSGADALHTLALQRIDKLMNAESGTPEGEELSALVDACVAYERHLLPDRN